MTPMVVNTLKEWRLESGERDGLVFPGAMVRRSATTCAPRLVGRIGSGISSRRG